MKGNVKENMELITPLYPQIVERYPEVLQLKHPYTFIKFCEWTATPDPLRRPEKQQQFAKMVKVDYGTLSDWKRHERFYDIVYYFLKQWGKSKTSNVMLSFYRNAVKFGNAAEVKLWAQLFEDYREKSEVESKSVNINYVITRGNSEEDSSEEEDRLISGTDNTVAQESSESVESIPIQDSGSRPEREENNV